MKNALFLVVFLVSGVLVGQELPKSLKSVIRKVTVFQSGAVVERTADASLEVGMNQVYFSGFPANLNSSGLMVKTNGNAAVLSVGFHSDSLKLPEKVAELKYLNDSLKGLQALLNTQLARQKGLLAEQEMLNSNRALGGSNVGLKVADLREGAQFFRQRGGEIAEGLFVIEERLKELRTLIQLVVEKIKVVRPLAIKPALALEVMVESNRKQQIGFEISYFVPGAGWTPLYDLRAIDVTRPIEWVFKAQIQQNTGEDWKGVDLVLSTGSPSENALAPVLRPLYYDILEPKMAMRGSRAADQAPAMAKESSKMEADMDAGRLEFSQVAMVESQTRISYEIPVPYTIASQGKPVVAEIWKKELKADFEYFCIPKLKNDVFLKAYVTGWDDLNLLPGQASVFFENSFVGQSFISTGSLSDTLEVSLGRDPSILVTREKIKEFSGANLIGTVQKKTEGWEITVRNGKKQAVDIRIVDQFPLSANKLIEVERMDHSKGEVNDQTGEVVWKWKLAPSESRKIKLVYALKFPKHEKIRNFNAY